MMGYVQQILWIFRFENKTHEHKRINDKNVANINDMLKNIC